MARQDQLRVIITGASSGIGMALAQRYASQGAVLGLIARRGIELDRLAARLACDAKVYALDVRDSGALQQADADFISSHGCPDIVIASAGVSAGTLTEYADDSAVFQEIMDCNVTGMMKTFQPFVTAMRAAGKGALVGISSVAGYRGLPGAAAYSASKAAAIAYLESLRVELHTSGVKVITVCPGYIATPMTVNNPYPMPFIMSADTAAGKIIAIITRGKTFTMIPWQMALVARVLRVLPNWLYDRLFARAPHKPRRSV
jgi:short-subunit dehydrogenase